jgi:hypothetical protein
VYATVCNTCRSELATRIATAAEAVLAAHSGEIDCAQAGNVIRIGTERFDYTNFVLHRVISGNDRALLKRGVPPSALGLATYAQAINDSVQETLLAMRAPVALDTTTVVGSRANLLVIRQMRDQAVAGADIAAWEANRATDIPWIKQLNLQQTLALRNKASTALPRFRTRMATSMSDAAIEESKQIQGAVTALREDAAEVEQELKALSFNRGRRFRALATSLSLTISVYGFAADFLPAAGALTGLMSALALIHQDSRKAHQERDRLESRSGFVLLKAKDLLTHASARSPTETPAALAALQSVGRPRRSKSA